MRLTRRTAALAALSLFALGACTTGPATPETVIYLVRHAEKEAGPDPELTLTGQARAEILAQELADAGLTAIWSTDYARTRQTAAPSAKATGLLVRIYDPGRLEEFAAKLKLTPGNILVVGHSNTTPELAGLLGGDPGPAIDEAAEYDRLYVVTVTRGRVKSELRRYGD